MKKYELKMSLQDKPRIRPVIGGFECNGMFGTATGKTPQEAYANLIMIQLDICHNWNSMRLKYRSTAPMYLSDALGGLYLIGEVQEG